MSDRAQDGLPAWAEMTDLDKGAALLHVWKRRQEGSAYATEHYPARYLTDPTLVALDRKAASRHAVSVTGGYKAIRAQLGKDEYDRLYEQALAHHETRLLHEVHLS
jgi:hypothetical protein